jgi:hypothetical protein
MAEVITTHRYVRSVSGNLISSQITDTQSMRIEILKRTSRPKLQWHFRQPEFTLFWFQFAPRATQRLARDGPSSAAVVSDESLRQSLPGRMAPAPTPRK